jgi:hypothetical protein
MNDLFFGIENGVDIALGHVRPLSIRPLYQTEVLGNIPDIVFGAEPNYHS